MTDRPIIFSAPMVRALLDGRKTQTRRVLKPQPPGDCVIACIASNGAGWAAFDGMGNGFALSVAFAPGDRLWVREAFVTGFNIDDELGRPIGDWKIWYRATDAGLTWYDPDTESTLDNPPWKPSTHMPRRASRLTLTVTDVRVQRVQEISEADAVADGIEPFDGIDPECAGFRNYNHHAAAGVWLDPRASFQSLWTSLHGPEAWDANPWVVALTFDVKHSNIDAVTT